MLTLKLSIFLHLDLSIWLLHLDDEIAIVRVNLLLVEAGAARAVAPAVRADPPIFIKAVKVISPMPLKCPSLLVICLNFDIVIGSVKWHVSIREIIAPPSVGWRPEVHK